MIAGRRLLLNIALATATDEHTVLRIVDASPLKVVPYIFHFGWFHYCWNRNSTDGRS